jgi:hypothetical protein
LGLLLTLRGASQAVAGLLYPLALLAAAWWLAHAAQLQSHSYWLWQLLLRLMQRACSGNCSSGSDGCCVCCVCWGCC